MCDDLLTWGLWMQTDARTVEESFIQHPLTSIVTRVSTVFLGLDHRFFGDGPPILFETMAFTAPELVTLFGGEPRWIARSMDYQRRYCTWEQAVAGHSEVHNDILRSVQIETTAITHKQETGSE